MPIPAPPSAWPVPGIDDRDPIHVMVTDPRVLEHLDGPIARPFALTAVLGRIHDGLGWPSGGDALAGFAPSWGAIADTLAADLDQVVVDMAIDWETEIDRTYDTTAAKTAIGADAAHRGNGNVARVFAAAWLRSPDARAPLAAVVYRPDRADFVPGTCGELRLVYRLAYERTEAGPPPKTAASRLPFTINVVFTIPDDGAGCREVARSFRAPAALDDASAAVTARALLAGPLAQARSRFTQIELNAQIVRFPSDLERVEGRGFAGQALYWLRIFAPAGERLAPIGLENTPDVQAIAADPAKRARLLAWIGDELAAIDRGVFLLPPELLASVALSWSTHGSARAANRPFAALVESSQADAVVSTAAFTGTFVHDGRSLLERLDGATCMGCHQSSSTAGFHLLGVDRPYGVDPEAVVRATDGNRVQSPLSPHAEAELPRRADHARALATGAVPRRLRPHPSAPPAVWGTDGPRHRAATLGMPCPLPALGASPPWATWSCDAGMTCRALASHDGVRALLGQCVPAQADVHAGAPCRGVTIASTEPPTTGGLSFNVRAFTDRVRDEVPLYAMPDGALGLTSYSCRPASIGVPLGRVTRRCRSDEHRLLGFDTGSPAEICAIVGGKGFEAMATGAFDPQAFAAGVGRGLLDVCDADRPCREDYICQQLPAFLATARHPVAPERLAAASERGIGFCTPTYFVYQLRADGHPSPR